MTSRLFNAFLIAFLAFGYGAGAHAQPGRNAPVFDTWSADCASTGVCSSSSLTRNQSVWVDLRIIRDWQADALPLVRLTTNTVLPDTGTLQIDVDGKTVEALPIEQLREIQSAISSPAGFRPLGGDGFWYPSGAVTLALLQALQTGKELTIHLPQPKGAAAAIVTVPLSGLTPSLSWLDAQQNRTGTVSAVVTPGTEAAVDAPHALPILSPDDLPAEVAAIWRANRLCSTLDPAIFASLNPVRVPLPDGTSLYVVPCGTPSAHNGSYVVIYAGKDGAARQVHVARMTDKGPIATDLIYNARWIPAENQLVSYFKGSGIGECGLWNRWAWNGTGLVLLEEASRETCDGIQPDLSKWSNTWPLKNTPK